MTLITTLILILTMILMMIKIMILVLIMIPCSMLEMTLLIHNSTLALKAVIDKIKVTIIKIIILILLEIHKAKSI